MEDDFYKGDFFVMLTTQDGNYTPLTRGEGEASDIAKFETEEAARECVKNNPFGEHFGFEIFERGCGV
jgi:hypothetical protein